MINETSAGIVLFQNISDENQFLLLNYPQGHWDFVKGKIEKNEELYETARREAAEETGITDLQFIDGFTEYVEYDFRFKNEIVHKKVIFFLAKTDAKNVCISHEHIDYIWLGYNHAFEKITYKNAMTLMSTFLTSALKS